MVMVVMMVVVVVGGMSVQRGSLGGEVHVREGKGGTCTGRE